MSKLITIIVMLGLLVMGTEGGCEPQSGSNRGAGGAGDGDKKGPKPCLSDSKVAHPGVHLVELIWDAAVRPFTATGYAKDYKNPRSGKDITFNEIVTAPGPLRLTLAYNSGCVVLIMIRMSNEGKVGKAYVKITDGEDNTCEWREEFVLSLRCDLYTER